MRNACGIAAALMLLTIAAGAVETRYHGIKMDERHKLLLEQEDGVVRITVVTRERSDAGAPSEPAGGRVTDRVVLAEVQSEPLESSSPSYLRNPAQRYRITVKGVAVCPDHKAKRAVVAADARRFVEEQLRALAGRTSGIERDALGYAAPMVLGVLTEAGKLPAPVLETIKHSVVGRTRITPDTLQRRPLPAGRSLESKPASPSGS